MSTESAILNKQKNIFDKCVAKTNALELSFLRARPCCLFRIPGRPQINPKLGVDHILERYNEYTTAQIEKSCAKCIKQENNGVRSKRMWLNSQFKNSEYDFYYDFQLSNLCNLACKMCSPNFSSRLVKPFEFYRKNGYDDFNGGISPVLPNKWDWEIVDKIFEDINQRTKDKKIIIEFKGGEPTMQPEFEEFFYKFENPQNVRLDIISNLQRLPDYFIENIKKFGEVNVGVSLEGTEETYEYIRTLGDWKTFKTNIETLTTETKSFTNKVALHFHPKVISYGLSRLQDLIDFMDYGASLGFKPPSENSIAEIIWTPYHSCPLYLPKEYVENIVARISHKRDSKLKNLLLNSNTYTEEQMQNTLKFIELTDKFNNKDFWQTPTGLELKNYL